MFYVVGHLALVGNTTLEVPSTGKMPRSSGQQREVHASAIIVEPTLQERTVNDGQDPLEARHGIGALLQFPR